MVLIKEKNFDLDIKTNTIEILVKKTFHNYKKPQPCFPLILNKKDNPKYPKILVYITKLLYIKIEIKRETLWD